MGSEMLSKASLKLIIILLVIVIITSNLYWKFTDDSIQANNQMMITLRMNNTVSDFYQDLRDVYLWNMPESNGIFENATKRNLNLGANLAKHDIGIINWSSFGCVNWNFTETRYFEYTGTHSYDDARAILQFFINVSGVQSNDSVTEIVEKILWKVHEYITYSQDITYRCISPWETLSFGSGDCDNFSILVAALFELAGIDSAIASYYQQDSDYGHATVLIHSDDVSLNGIPSYSNLTVLGLSEGKWIIIDPQSTIEEQHDSTFFSKWHIRAATDV